MPGDDSPHSAQPHSYAEFAKALRARRTFSEVEASADELAQRFMDYEPKNATEASIKRGLEQAARGEVSQRDDLLDEDSEPRTLTEFLLARIAEDEAWVAEGTLSVPTSTPASGVRILRDAKAKRRIVELCWSPDWTEGEDTVLLALASVYADHPDYRQEWKP